MKTIEQLTASETAWYSSNDTEVWHGGPYATREEAEDGAKAEEHEWIMRATKFPIRVSEFFSQGCFFEAAEESLYDQSNDEGDPILDFTPAINLDLQSRVQAAIDEWQVAHQLSPMPWRFSGSDEPEIAAWAKAKEGGAA